MGVVEQLKKLHKQKKIKTSDIPRVKASGVDVDTYLNRARALDSYITKPKSDVEEEKVQTESAAAVVEEQPTASTAASSTKKRASAKKV